MPTSVAGEPIPATDGHLRPRQHLSPSPPNPPISASAKSFCTRVESRNGGADKRRGSISNSPQVKSLFGRVPSRSEVEKALSDLQHFMTGAHTSESGWYQRVLSLCDTRILQCLGYAIVKEAFRLLQTDPSFKRMVISISCDPAVWNAILNNQAVQKLRESILLPESLRSGAEVRPEITSEPDLVTLILKWILDIAAALIMELVERFSSLVSDLFRLPERKEAAAEINGELDIKLRSSLLLSILILVIVVVTRALEANLI
ncbi:hypothetical protein NMG60_11023102 [Bertholletia excelsa]